MIGFSLPFLLSFGWWAIGIAAVIALFLICLIVYLLALIFTDGDTAVQIAIGVVGCPIGIAIGCFFSWYNDRIIDTLLFRQFRCRGCYWRNYRFVRYCEVYYNGFVKYIIMD